MDSAAINTEGTLEKKDTIKLSELIVGTPYPIESLRIVTTCFGNSVLVELADKVVFLPKQETQSLKGQEAKFTAGKFSLVYKGSMDEGMSKDAHQFELIENEKPVVDKICGRCRQVYPVSSRELCDKCFIKGGLNGGKWIPFNVNSWDSYEEFKKWQLKYDRRQLLCEKCGKLMNRTDIYRHMRNIHKVESFSVQFA